MFFNDTATTEIYTLSLPDALPISPPGSARARQLRAEPEPQRVRREQGGSEHVHCRLRRVVLELREDRKSTRLNSSHANISYAVLCLKKKKPRPISYPVLCLKHNSN